MLNLLNLINVLCKRRCVNEFLDTLRVSVDLLAIIFGLLLIFFVGLNVIS